VAGMGEDVQLANLSSQPRTAPGPRGGSRPCPLPHGTLLPPPPSMGAVSKSFLSCVLEREDLSYLWGASPEEATTRVEVRSKARADLAGRHDSHQPRETAQRMA
jgi:hypothetical protein